jgi:hypothetical protein
MPDPIPTSVSEGASTGGDTGTNVEQLAAMVAALAASVQTMVQQMANASAASSAWQKQVSDGLSQLETNVASMKTEVAGATDSDSGYLIRTSVDPASEQRRMAAFAEMAVADTIEFRKAVDKLVIRQLSVDTDHHQPSHLPTTP